MWHILGAGSMGLLWALRLHKVGEVTLLRRPESTPGTIRVRYEGLTCAECEFPTLPVSSALEVERLVIATKAHQTEEALLPLMPVLPPQSTLLLLQNGMGVAEWIKLQRPDIQVLQAISMEGAYRMSPEHIVHAGHGAVWLGNAFENHLPVDIIAELQQAIPNLSVESDILTRLWHKLAINCAINPLTVKFDCPNGELLDNAEALTLLQDVCHEVAIVMRAKKIRLPYAGLIPTVTDVCRRTAGNISSMLADVRARRPTEIDYINGFLIDQAKSLGIPVPVNQQLIDVVHNRLSVVR